MQHLHNSALEDEVKEKVIKTIGEISIPKKESDKIKLSDSLDRHLNVDSLGFIEMIIEFENDFNISFDDDFLQVAAYPDVQTVVEQVLKMIIKKQAKGSEY